MSDLKLSKLSGKTCSWIWRNRTKRKINKFKRVVTTNYDVTVFDKITKTCSYWLGYYFSDGCVCKSKNRYLICLSSNDKESLDKLSKFYRLKNHKINKTKINNRLHYSLQLCNEYLFNKLNSLGCMPKKSLILKSPKIDAKFYDSFMMGVFDGDGSISLNKSINQWKVSIGTGSLAFANWIKQLILNKKLIYNFEKRTKNKKHFYNITLIGNCGKIFLKKLYASVDSTLPLSRKKMKFKEMSKIKKWKGPNFQKWEIEILLSNNNLDVVSDLIKSDNRNYGWERSVDTLRHKKQKIT